MRLSEELRERIDAWAEKQTGQPGRSEAIRRLVEIGLDGGKPARRRSAKSAERAKQLAAKTIDRLMGTASEEAASRKRRLLKGPEEFHEVRVDHGPFAPPPGRGRALEGEG
jgi:hypothetical protein